ncbi:MAG TPA: ribose 5-phosphate isomerase B [Blastocatellia bacterium]|jgi:ribose 5-phosphate isomerase B|nr:ribose 5-phosphate isomerase B [Blastocatellia bacterium]
MSTIDERGKHVITENEIRTAATGDILRIDEDAMLTPLAQDLVRERGIQIDRVRRRSAVNRKKIALGADHGGFEMKEQVKSLLADLGHEYQDFGTHSTAAVDYPDYAHVVARAVAGGTCDLGIVIDGAGIGSCMAANKVPGVRAAMCYDEASARNSREHNGANVLTLGGKMISAERMREIVRAWLGTELTEDRHRRRVEKIDAIAREYSKPNCN